MSTRALDLLARMKKDELDRQRQQLAAEEAVRHQLTTACAATQSTILQAIDGINAPGAGPSNAEPLPFDVVSRLVEGNRRRKLDLEKALQIQDRRCQAVRERLGEQMIAVKRLELVAERRRRAKRVRMDHREQNEIEELATIRHSRLPRS
ncbi:MAG: hypothetical protein H6851_12875 [Geminicoccaceae bacterium]|nr:hypothetical protein [Geminicoccaceae bacterium]MCB9944498.1 hypothetical protein [Geminicoccaceae bacterium]